MLDQSEVEKLVGTERLQEPVATPNRRARERHRFRCLRTAAIWDEKASPGPLDFYDIRCQDLSTQGIGFYSPEKPDSDFLVIRLHADSDKPIVVGAKVVYCNDKSGDPSYPFVVGCMFTRRLQ